jgi:hypothetical protein
MLDISVASIRDCFPARSLDVLLSHVTGNPEQPHDVKAAIESLTSMRNYWLKRAKKRALKQGKVYSPPSMATANLEN